MKFNEIVKPNLTSTRAGEKIEFLDVQAAIDGENSGGGGNGGGGDVIPDEGDKEDPLG